MSTELTVVAFYRRDRINVTDTSWDSRMCAEAHNLADDVSFVAWSLEPFARVIVSLRARLTISRGYHFLRSTLPRIKLVIRLRLTTDSFPVS
jgi:hypothetical protein